MCDSTGLYGEDWGDEIEVDLKITDMDIANYDALILPGGQINPDLLRVNDDAISLIRDFAATGKPVAAICHAPWLLIAAGLANGRRLTSYKSFRTDFSNHGAHVLDESQVVRGNRIHRYRKSVVSRKRMRMRC